MKRRLPLAIILALTPAFLSTAGHAQPPSPMAAARQPSSWEGFMQDVGGDQFVTLILRSDSDGGTGTFVVLGQNLPVSDVRWSGDRVTARVGAPADNLSIEARRENGGLVGELREGRNVQALNLRAIPDYPVPRDRTEAWGQDLDVLATRFVMLDQAFSRGERTMFLEAVETLRAELPHLNDAQVIMRIASAVALADEPHTRLYLLRNATELRRLPIRLWWFSDGLYVVRTTPAHRDLLGCRIDDFAGTSARHARDIVGRAFAGNASWRDYMSVYTLTSAEGLHGTGIAPSLEEVEVGVSGCRGPARRTLRPLPLARSDRRVEAWWDLSPLIDNPHGASSHILPSEPRRLPLYLRNPNANYWFEHQPATGIVYVQYNRAQHMSEERMGAFGERLVSEIARTRPRALVVDLRFNTGGDSGVSRDFVRLLAERAPNVPRYIITGRATFSAGISAIAQLLTAGPATIVGEPAGDDIDHWSEGGFIRMPNSGIEVDFQTGFHSYSPASCPAEVRCAEMNVPSISPAVRASPSWADYRAGRDPSMEAVERLMRGGASR